MTIPTIILVLAFAATSIPATFAATGSTYVAGKEGFRLHPMSTATSISGAGNLLQSPRGAVLADGAVFLNGEAGYVEPAQVGIAVTVAEKPGGRVLGGPGHGASSAPVSDAEQRASREQYAN